MRRVVSERDADLADHKSERRGIANRIRASCHANMMNQFTHRSSSTGRSHRLRPSARDSILSLLTHINSHDITNVNARYFIRHSRHLFAPNNRHQERV